MGLAQAPWSLPFTFLISVPLLFWLHSGAISQKRGALIGWLAGVGYFGLTLSWIVEPFLVDIDRYGWMAPFALIFMAGGLALFWGLAFWIARRGSILALAVFWTLAGLLRSYIFTGFPWALPAYGWTETPLIQMVSLIGPHGLGLLTFLSILLIAKSPRHAIAGVAMLIAMGGYGSYRLSQPLVERDQPFTVRILQPNAEQHLKWEPEYAIVFFERQLEMSAASPTPDLVIWPEAAIPFLPSQRPDLLERMASAANGATVLTGTRRQNADGQWFNGLILLDDKGAITGTYDKHHLVPFGEYFPLSNLLQGTPLKGLTGTGYNKGQGPTVLDIPDIPPFLPLICYEAIFPQHAGITGQRPDWLIQITNDAWFGQFSGPFQHLAQSKVRAIEQGLPMARSANTGISGMIDPYGRIQNALALGETGFVDVALPAAIAQPLYSRTKDWPVLILLTALAIIIRPRKLEKPLGNP